MMTPVRFPDCSAVALQRSGGINKRPRCTPQVLPRRPHLSSPLQLQFSRHSAFSSTSSSCHRNTSSSVSTAVQEGSDLIGLGMLQHHLHSTPPPPPPPHLPSHGGHILPVDTTCMEARVEKVIYNCRFMTFLAIAGTLLGSILCFLKGCIYVIDSFTKHCLGGKVILTLVEALDMYLIGTVMLVLGMGLYGLFISNSDNSKTSSDGSNLLGLFRLPGRPKWFEIQSINELKTKLGHAIVMVLLVGMFEKSKRVTISSPLDLLCFSASVLLSSGCIYLLSRLHHDSKGEMLLKL